VSLFKLVVSLKDAEPTEYALEKSKTLIGRATGNDIILPDNEKRVSSKHAHLEMSGSTLQLTDLGSTNGTFVNDRRIDANSPVDVKEGDKIGIGLYLLKLSAVEEDQGDRTMVVVDPSRQLAQLVEELPILYARYAEQPVEQRRKALRSAIQGVTSAVGPEHARSMLAQLRSRFRGVEGPVVPDRTTTIKRRDVEIKKPAAEAVAEKEGSAQAGLRVLNDLSAHFLGESKLETPEQMELFGKLILNSLELTFDWISKSLRGRKEFEEQFSADLSMIFSKEKNPLKGGGGPGDMGRYLLDWRLARDPQQIKDALDNAFKDLTMHQLGLLAGVQESLSAVLKRLDPRIVEQEAKEKGGGGMFASAEKKAWKRYSDVFHEIFAENSKMFNELIYPNVRKGYLALHDENEKSAAEKKGETKKSMNATPSPSMTRKETGNESGGKAK
jgi:type VI secretion system FHA domain protein